MMISRLINSTLLQLTGLAKTAFLFLLFGLTPCFGQRPPTVPSATPRPVASPTVSNPLPDPNTSFPSTTSAIEPSALPLSYPAGWDVPVPQQTALEKIKELYERRRVRLPNADLQDQSPLPVWFRAYLRNNLPELSTTGKYQYPRVAAQILQWMISHPDLTVPPSTPNVRSTVRTITVGHNINLTNFDERNSESFIAQDYNAPEFLVAASNNITGSGRLKVFYSSDAGATWTATELPLAEGTAFHSDPAVSFSSDGTAWIATLGIDSMGTKLSVQMFKSVDRGKTWSYVKEVSTGKNNDKEMLAIDSNLASPFKDNIYVAWDVPGGGVRFTRSTNRGITWQRVVELSNDAAIGVHLTVGQSGELYVAWPDVDTRQLRIRKSMDGGATFSEIRSIATTNSAYEVSIPGMCQRKVLVYLSIGVDRSVGPQKGSVYATWTDRNGTEPDPGCSGTTDASNSNIYFSASRDGGNTWSTPRILHADSPNTDQFNQWMDVDIEDGTIHVAFYDTRDDPGRRKTHLYYVQSRDGGASWVNETRISSEQSDETADGSDAGNQYGDYNGLVAHRNVAFPTWTDRRTTNPGIKEQIFTASITSTEPIDTDQAISDLTRAISSVNGQVASQRQNESRAVLYPQEWDVAVQPGSKLEQLKRSLERQRSLLPAGDAEDRTPIPAWFRVFLRKRNKDLPTSGPYQYPRVARRLFQFYLDNPNSVPNN